MGTKKNAFEDLLTEEELASLADDEGGADPDETGADDADDETTQANEAGAGEDDDGDDNTTSGDPDPAAAAPDNQPDAQNTADVVADAQAGGDQAAAAEAPQASADAAEDNTSDIPEEVDPATWLNKTENKERIKELDAQLDALADRFDNGEFTAAEYRQQQRKLQDQRDDLRSAVDQATFREDNANQGWNKACRDFMKDNPVYAKAGPLASMLDAEVRRIQTAYIEKGFNYFDPSILARAEQNVRRSAAELLGVQIESKSEEQKSAANAASAKQPPTPTPPKAMTPQQRKQEPVPTLSGVPVAGEEAIGSGEFAWLDRLADSDPLRYEAEMKKLEAKEPEKYQQYLAYAN